MAKLSLEELRALRARESVRLEKRDIHGKQVHVVVGMGTCGIQAGAVLVHVHRLLQRGAPHPQRALVQLS